MRYTQYQLGFSLVELMIAMVLGLFILSGVGLMYSSVSQTTKSSKDVELNLEIIRFSSHHFTNTLKQTTQLPTIATPDQLVINHSKDVRSCMGDIEASDFQEQYSVVDGFLVCEVNGTKVKLLKGVDSVAFSLNNLVVSIELTASSLPTNLNQKIDIDVALTAMILAEEF